MGTIPVDAIRSLVNIVTEEWGETESANVVYEWLEQADTGGSAMTVDTARLRELHAAATAGEWWQRGQQIYSGNVLVCVVPIRDNCAADMDGIAAVHNALPAVLDALEQARAERDALAAELAQVRAQLVEAQASIEYWKDEEVNVLRNKATQELNLYRREQSARR